jgi:hypothetical protein
MKDADIIDHTKGGRTNKQQRNSMQTENKVNKARRDVLIGRRGIVQDWAGSAMAELVDQRDFLEQFSLKHYMKKSIVRFQELKGRN